MVKEDPLPDNVGADAVLVAAGLADGAPKHGNSFLNGGNLVI
jgi:hypothetical protein